MSAPGAPHGLDQQEEAGGQPLVYGAIPDGSFVYRDGYQLKGATGSAVPAPSGAQYLVGALDATLTAERVVTDTSTVAWDLATASQAKASIPDGGVSYAKLQDISAASRLIGRGAGGGSGDAQEIVLGTNLSMSGTTLNAASSADGLGPDGDKGDITVGGTGTTLAIDTDAVTYAKMQNVSAASRLIGRGSAAGAGDPEEITLGTNLSMSGTTLNASGGGGGGASATTVESALGSPKFAGKFTITDAAIAATSKVLCWQAPGPYTGKGTRADEAEMQPVQVVSVEPATGSAVVKWQTPPMISSSAIPSAGGQPASALVPGLKDSISVGRFSPRRLGKVGGNVKFTYAVFA